MLNTNPELINMSSNSTASEIYKNPRYKIENNKMNTSVNLPNSDKININIRSNLQNRHRNNNNNALFIKDNSEEEIKSIKDKIRKKYKSPPKDYNNNIPDINEIKPYEHNSSYQIKNENLKNTNSRFIKIRNIPCNIGMNY